MPEPFRSTVAGCSAARVLGPAALLLSFGIASAQTTRAVPAFPQAPQPTSAGWTSFREPSEGAYTVDVPQGWRVAGGVKRYAASEAPVWMTAQSPDGSVELFLGDPALPTYSLPGRFTPEGSQMPGLHNHPWTVMRYRPGAEFSQMYGLRSLTSICANVQFQGAHKLPNLEDEMRQHVQTATRLDAGQANFTCERNGQPFAAAVQAGTGEVLFPGADGAGVWGVASLRGYVAPAAEATQAEQILAHVAASFKLDPQFETAVKQAAEAENETARQQMERQAPATLPYSQAPNVPAPYIPTPRPRVNSCDDLQQRRICNINDGHLVSSGGCLVCVSP